VCKRPENRAYHCVSPGTDQLSALTW
jgi:hypothetical protein